MANEVKIKKKKRKSNRYKRMRFLMFIFLIVSVSIMLFKGGDVSGFDKGSMKEIGDPNTPVPEIVAEAAELYCINLEEPVYQKNADKKLDPYSITKILTCYLAIENLELDQIETISEYAATPLEDGTTIYLKEGEEISVKDLLYGAMLESGNDAATALGEAVSGSEEKFADLMNKQAKEWGCENTHFVNANGWKNEDHYTTAHDMALITARSFENKTLREIAMTEEYTIPETNMSAARELSSHTLRGKTIDYIVGGKTGAWESDDASLAVAFEKRNLKGAAVVLKTKSKVRKSDVNELIAVSQDLTPGFIATEEGEVICEAKVKGGKTTKTKLSASDTIYAYPKKHKKSGIKVKLDRDKLKAPLSAGVEAGTYTVLVDGEEVQTGTLITTEDIEKGWFLSNFYVSDKTSLMIGAFVIIWFVLLAILKKIL